MNMKGTLLSVSPSLAMPVWPCEYVLPVHALQFVVCMRPSGYIGAGSRVNLCLEVEMQCSSRDGSAIVLVTCAERRFGDLG